ncbi:hypothetical protein B0H17DRAFT_1325114 [Mycena rosella]|uniref:Stealth protein CR3 conserved region 3 domain-containing protein n=1 Tax=Mycena rosella TaxID=1033263 RepID=A0AAD7GYL5_MYCRO|nr:hypothetical protein B0H17DRAFT_1325114 [Mycena rosella]
MSTRSLYLYQPLGGKPSSPLRDVLCNPVRCTAILLVVALSLGSIGFFMIQQPWGSVLAPNMSFPAHETEPSVSVDPSIPEVPPPVAEVVATSVYHPFVAPSPADSIVDQRVRPIKAHSVLSDDCLDTWVSTGQWQPPCHYDMVQDATIDLVYVWVNGSDVLHQKARNELLASTKYKTKDARFREHDELRYSLRSARNATATWPNSTWHIITADVPDPNTNNNTAVDHNRRLGLVPQWLDIQCAFRGQDGHPPIRLQHDSQLFRLTGRPGAALESANATDWLDKILPSFNSHAVESQLPQLDPRIVSENIVALNDDQFMALPLPPSAFHTTLYGQVFRMDPNLMVGGDSSGSADGGGEWRSLGWSAHLLNERFGTRKRPYMHHNARALSLPLMHELSLAFGSYFAATPLSQFRGSHKVAGEYEVNTIFMSTQYVIERHREALLWSWVVAKWGRAEGLLTRDLKHRMWLELGGAEDDAVTLLKTEGSAEDDVEVNLLMAGLQLPRAFDAEKQADTTYSWVSMDGYNPSFRSSLPQSVLQRDECIGKDEESAWDMFRRLLKESPSCGDNVISSLIQSSESGLSVFLPPPSTQNIRPSPSDPIILPLELPAHAPPLPRNPRAFVVRLLMRYAYVLGDSPTIFMGLKSPLQGERLLKAADQTKDVALICINDDLGNGDQTAANTMLRSWFQRRWPEKLECEL